MPVGAAHQAYYTGGNGRVSKGTRKVSWTYPCSGHWWSCSLCCLEPGVAQRPGTSLPCGTDGGLRTLTNPPWYSHTQEWRTCPEGPYAPVFCAPPGGPLLPRAPSPTPRTGLRVRTLPTSVWRLRRARMQTGCAMMWLSGGRCAGSRLSRLRTSWRSSGLYRSEIGAKVPLIIFSTSAGRFCEGRSCGAGQSLRPGS